MGTTNRETLRTVIDDIKNSDGEVSQEQWNTLLLTSIANSLAIIADALTDRKDSVTPQEPRWISVSERLPKAGEYIGGVERYYLVQNEYGDMLVARYPHSGYWEQIYQQEPIDDEIVAWMPLPESYKA